MKKEDLVIGYSTGVFDLFHIGHLNVLEKAKEHCDFLLVGVTTDEEAFRVKGIHPIIAFEERIRIIQSLKCVDKAIPEDDVDKIKAWYKNKYDVIFKGDDWKGTEKWNRLEGEFSKLGVKVVYFPYTNSTSSTILREVLAKIKAVD